MEPIGALRRDVVDANSLKNMVGPWGLEPQTSTVSIITAAAPLCTFLPRNLSLGQSFSGIAGPAKVPTVDRCKFRIFIPRNIGLRRNPLSWRPVRIAR